MKVTEKNGYRISEFTLGTVQLGIPYGINNTHGMPTFSKAQEILQTAIDHGVVSFDTAKGYGKSEAVLGQFFAGKETPKTIITKVEFDKETPQEIERSLFAKAEDSARVMGLSEIPVVLLHSEKYLESYGNSLIKALKKLRATGLVKSIGISFSDKSKLFDLTDPDIFDSVQIPSNMFDNAEIRDGKIKKLSDMGVSVYVRSVYLQGLFFKDTSSLPDKIKSAKAPLEKIATLAADNNMSIAALALSYMRGISEISSLVMGCDTSAQLEETLSLFNLPLLSKSVIDKIMEISEEVEPVVIRPWEWNS